MGDKQPAMASVVTPQFWLGRRVLLTGQTGFKGAWLAFWLAELGAEVSGLALPPATTPNLYNLLKLGNRGRFIFADINNREALARLVSEAKPEIVIHLAAQALVRPSYAAPIKTFAANALGTVTLLDVVRDCAAVRSVVIVTSDKAYENNEWDWGYRETDRLGGFDPYSASKACAEIATASMRRSFFGPGKHPARIATARAGNVIGGGDWSADRLVPDIIRSCLVNDGAVSLRNPRSVRPWQHVLDPLRGYLILAERLYHNTEGYDDAWNFGPDASSVHSVQAVAEVLIAALDRGHLELAEEANSPHETVFLSLDCAKARARLAWIPLVDFQRTVKMTADWYIAWSDGGDVETLTRKQIKEIS